MKIDERRLSPESFELCKSLTEMHNAKTRIEVIIKSDNINFESKKMLKSWQQKLDVILRDFKLNLPASWKSVFEEELLNDEDALQLDGIMTMLVKLPKGVKNEIENYVESRYDLFVKNN